MKVKSESEVARSCPTPHDPKDCSPPGSSIHGSSQARVLEWATIAFSGFSLHSPQIFGSSQESLLGSFYQSIYLWIYICMSLSIFIHTFNLGYPNYSNGFIYYQQVYGYPNTSSHTILSSRLIYNGLFHISNLIFQKT